MPVTPDDAGETVYPSAGTGNVTRVLVVYPPQVPTYFNAGHHLALYQVAGHLRKLGGSPKPAGSSDVAAGGIIEVDVVDGAVEDLTWRDLASRLALRDYAMVAVMGDIEGMEGTERLLAYVRRLSPRTRTVSFGRMTATVPEFVRRYDFDAIVESGDFETGVAEALRVFVTGTSRDTTPEAPGVAFRSGDAWISPITVGRRLDATDWYWPAPSELPLERYVELYGTDTRRFSGLPALQELVVPVARGCPIGCDFCEVPVAFGLREVRADVPTVLEYLEHAARSVAYDYVSFYSPTFTLNREWVMDLCGRLLSRYDGALKWKCCTTLHHLDRDLVETMSRSGCVRISVGLETLGRGGLGALPRIKERGASKFEDVASWCRESGVELNCFVILGLPGDSLADIEATLAEVRRVGGRVRPTFYTDWSLAAECGRGSSAESPEVALALLNRHLPPEGCGATSQDTAALVRLFYSAVRD